MALRLLHVHLRPYGPALALLAFLELAQVTANLLLPALNAAIVDNGVIQGDSGYIGRAGAAMLALALAQLAITIGAKFVNTRIALSLGRNLRSAVFRRVLHLSTQDYDRFGTPSLITRTVHDVQQVQTAAMAIDVGIAAVIMSLGSIVMVLRQDSSLAMIMVTFSLAFIAVIGTILLRMSPHYEKYQKQLDRLNQILREQITGIRAIRAFSKENDECHKIGQTSRGLFDIGVRVNRLYATITPVTILVANAGMVILLWFGGHRVEDGTTTPGALVSLLNYQMLILFSIVMATYLVAGIPQAWVSAGRIQEVLETARSDAESSRQVRTAGVRGHVDLRGVTFHYPGANEPALHEVDLYARPGETVAILGGTGSGKTTLLNLILRLSDTTGGSIHVNGVDLRVLDAGVLSRAVGLVPQRPYLFSGTIATNLRFANPDATDADLWRALEIAQARDFVEHMPDRLDSRVAQGGKNFSGGQRQRLAIARALLRRPTIYLFDDCFSALDNTTSAALRAELTGEISGATAIVTAQRISTIQHADRVVVLDQGRVVGTGTHMELMRDSEPYRAIALSQAIERQAE